MRVDLDNLLRRAKVADAGDRNCWYDHQELNTDFIADGLFIAAASPRVVIALVERCKELETCALAAVEIARSLAGPPGLGVHADNIAEIEAAVAKQVETP